MIIIDLDGYHIVDYLGAAFRSTLFEAEDYSAMFESAREFVNSQYRQFSDGRNSKLAIRYKWLSDYFQKNASDHGPKTED